MLYHEATAGCGVWGVGVSLGTHLAHPGHVFRLIAWPGRRRPSSPSSAVNVRFDTSVHGWRMAQYGGNGQCAVVGCSEAYTCCTTGHISW